MKIAVLIQDQYRLDDHPALNRAISLLQSGKAREVIALTHIYDHPEFPTDEPGRPFESTLCGPLRARFRDEAIESLQSKLHSFKIPILILNAVNPEEVKSRLNHESVDQIYYSTNHTLDPFWAKVLEISSIPSESFHGNHLFSHWPIPSDRFPKVFTDFKRLITSSPDQPDSKSLIFPLCESSSSSERASVHDSRSSIPFDGSEETALNRVQFYCFESDGLKNYKSTRNQMIGKDYSSKFSIFLSIGSLSARRVWAEVIRHEAQLGSSDGSEWMRFELLWREFFHWLSRKHGPSFYQLEGIQNKSMTYQTDRESFQKWIDGKTGSEFVDACMKELKTTGYLSNRGRQNVASYLVHTLQVPWHWGARYFEWILIDYDPAQNYGNWSYLAGVGADPRSFGKSPPRFFNIEKQAQDYDPHNAYRRLWNGID